MKKELLVLCALAGCGAVPDPEVRRPGAPRFGAIVPISARPPRPPTGPSPDIGRDLIVGAFNRSAFATVVERRSRFLSSVTHRTDRTLRLSTSA